MTCIQNQPEDFATTALAGFSSIYARHVRPVRSGVVRSTATPEGKVAVVVGGGNFFRGAELSQSGMSRDRADYMGMLATCINALGLQDVLEEMDVPVRVQTAIEMKQIAEPYIRRKAVRHLEKRRVVIFACGTGNPFFTTDTTAALRAAEIDADVIIKATKVDGVYNKDPSKFDDAVKYDYLTFDQVLDEKLGVMDLTAICLCRDHNVPLQVFDMNKNGSLLSVVMGEKEGTHVTK